jgi:hypothetical protein
VKTLDYSKPLISILVPSRGRKKQLKNLVANIANTVSNVNNIELLVKQDEDDPYTTIVVPNEFNIPSKVFLMSRSEYLNRDYYNFLASEASGKYFFAIGDDIRFNSKCWDLLLEEKIEEYLKDKPDRLAYIQVSEDGSEAKHPCFPLITRECFDLTHMYFHPQLLSWGADRCLYEIYSSNDIRRVLGVPEVHIEHLSYHDGTGQYDETAKSMRDRFFRDPQCHNKVSNYIVPQNIKFIKEYIEKVSNEEKIKREKDMI